MGELISELLGGLLKLIMYGLGILFRALFEVVLEGVWELFQNVMRAPFQRTALGYTVYGAIVGGISLFVFPFHALAGSWREISLIGMPVVAGAALSVFGWWRAGRRHGVVRRHRFAYGYLFALGLVLVRYWIAR
jgi:hypothetical protein